MGSCIITHSNPIISTLLWTNSSPTNSFAAQTLSLGSVNCKWFVVTTKNISGGGIYNNSFLNTALAVATGDTALYQIIFSIITGGIVYRLAGLYNDDGSYSIALRTGRFTYTNSSGTGVDVENNTYAIPYKIYGLS